MGTARNLSKLLNPSGALADFQGQLIFPATQNPSANANTLDDYEEGTFAAGLGDGTTSVALNSTCWYTKVGRMVTVAVFGYNQNFSALNASTHLRVTGLPFVPAGYMACPIVTHNTSTIGLIASINNGDSQAYISTMNGTIDANAATRNNILGGAATFSFRASFTYFTS